MRREGEGSADTLTVPNHRTIKASTLRTISTQAGIPREEFLRAFMTRVRGSRTVCLIPSLSAELVLIDEERARRAAVSAGLAIAGSIAVLERGALLKKVADLRAVYVRPLEQGIRFDYNLLEASLARLSARHQFALVSTMHFCCRSGLG
jgi:predicted nucleic acid-binding protein